MEGKHATVFFKHPIPGRRRHSSVDPLVKFVRSIKNQPKKRQIWTSLYKEVNRTDPSPSVRIPCPVPTRGPLVLINDGRSPVVLRHPAAGDTPRHDGRRLHWVNPESGQRADGVVRSPVVVGVKEFFKPLNKFEIVLKPTLDQPVNWNDLETFGFLFHFRFCDNFRCLTLRISFTSGQIILYSLFLVKSGETKELLGLCHICSFVMAPWHSA